MNETVTVKKNRLHPGFLALFAAAAIGLFALSTFVARQYLLGRLTGDIEGGSKVAYFILTFSLYLITMIAFSKAMQELMNLMTDRDRYVAVRKQSLENPAAQAIHQEYRKKMRRLAFINEAITDILVVSLLMLYILKGGSRSQFTWVVFLVCIIMGVNPVSTSFKKKEEAKRRAILLENCDPRLSFDVYELYRMEVLPRIIRNQTLFYQATACFYLGDYAEMERKLGQMEGTMMFQMKGGRILLLGLAAVDQGRMDLFHKYSEELHVLETAPRQLAVTEKYYQDIRRDWQGRLDLISEDPSKALLYVQKELEDGKHPLFWMDFTYQLAWIQLYQGDKERAKENLRLVAERAGTMAIREKAQKLLDVV